MKTDDLIKMLGTQVEPVDPRTTVRTISFAAAIGGLVAFGVMLVLFGVRTDLSATRALVYCLVKVAFALAITIPAFLYLTRVARPGGERKTSLALMVAPFVGIMLFAAISLVFAPSSHWHEMIVGDQWLECLLSIPIIAIVPFAAVIFALRQMAPTDLVRTGALGGLFAGAISAIGYALHCTDDSLPFVALWYGGTVVFCTLAGALLGPKLLRW